MTEDKMTSETARPHFYLFMPTYDGTGYWDAFAALHRAADGLDCTVEIPPARRSSLLPHNFNVALADAYNRRRGGGQGDVTHFAMLHADVVPFGIGWLRKLYEEMQRVQVEVISGIIAIKDSRNVTSTAWYRGFDRPPVDLRPGFDNDRINYLAIANLRSLPVTIVAPSYDSIVAGGDQILLVNTGMMLMTIETARYFSFQVGSWIDRSGEEWVAKVLPEDWDMSLRLLEHRIPYAATQVVTAAHIGPNGFLTTR